MNSWNNSVLFYFVFKLTVQTFPWFALLMQTAGWPSKFGHCVMLSYHTNICYSTYHKVPVVRRLDFELWGCIFKISQNVVPKSNLRCHILWNLQYLIFKLLETLFLCQNWLQFPKYQYFVQISKFQEPFFSKSTFHQSVMTSSINLPYLKNAMSDFKNFCTKIEMKEQPVKK